MKNIAAIFLSIMLTAAHAALVHAKDDGNRGYGFLMLEEPISPRNAAMGSAGAALGGYGFRYYNPAQPFFSPAMSSYASAEFGQMPGGVNMGGFETAALFTEWFSAISFFSSAVDFQTSDERGLGAVASSGTTVGALSVGYIRDKLAAGIGVSMVEDRIWVSSNYTALALSVGFGYKLFDDKLNLGAAWMNGAALSRGFVGDGSQWQDGRVPFFARAGAAWSDTLWSLPYTVAADAAYRDEDGTFTAPVGLEVKALPSISLRVGKRIGWESEILSIGIGFNIGRLSFDAAFVPTVFVSDYEMKWSMGFTYSMGRLRKADTAKVEFAPANVSASTEEEAVSKGEEAVSAETPAPTGEEAAAPGESASTEEDAASTEESAPTGESTPKDEAAPDVESTREEGSVPGNPVPAER